MSVSQRESVTRIIITPSMAKELLTKNTRNRPLSEKRSDMLASAMSRGEWAYNGDTICIAIDGGMAMINIDILEDATRLLYHRDMMKHRHNLEQNAMKVEIAKMLTNNFNVPQREVLCSKNHQILRTILASTPWI